jgi:hypothetical protein
MSSITISLIVFAIVFGGAMVGMFLRTVSPEHNLKDDTKDVVKMGMGMVATLSALVLGLLISSAKNSFDGMSTEFRVAASKVILLDRTLALYGPETKEARELLRSLAAGVVERMETKRSARATQVSASNQEIDEIFEKIQGLSPKDDRQRFIQARALGILGSIGEARWLIYQHESTSISMPMLIILVFWLATLFISFGLFAPTNKIAVASLMIAALSVSGAVFLILELYSPYGGIIRVLSTPLRAALMQMGN